MVNFASVEMMPNTTRTKWILMLLFFVPVVLAATYYLYWYMKPWQVDRKIVEIQEAAPDSIKYPPAELEEDFDPSLNMGIYKISQIDAEIEKVVLVYEWPASKVGIKLNPMLTCSGLNNKIFDLDTAVPRYVTIESIFETMQKTPLDQMILSGLCNDSKCSEINKECTLKIIREKYVPK